MYGIIKVLHLSFVSYLMLNSTLICSIGHFARVADFLICYRGLFLAVELKRPDGKGEATQRQLLELKKVRNAGGIGVVIESLDELVHLLGELDHEHQTTNH